MKKFAIGAVVLMMAFFVGMGVVGVGTVNAGNHGGGNSQKNHKVSICHAKGSKQKAFEKISVDKNSIINSPIDGHGRHKNDIIPSFKYEINIRGKKETKEYLGKNWSKENQRIWENDCKVPAKPDPINCKWGDFGQCHYFDEDAQCGWGKQFRSVVQEAKHGGKQCRGDKWKLCFTTCEDSGNGGASPTPSPTASPSPSPDNPPIGGVDDGKSARSSRMWLESLTCEDLRVRAKVEVKFEDNPDDDVQVTFKYGDKTVTTKTDKDGRAGASFDYTGEDDITAEIDKYGKKHLKVKTLSCDSQGDVLGTATDGQVLAAETMAETGVAADMLMSVLGLEGVVSTAVGALLYAKKRQ